MPLNALPPPLVALCETKWAYAAGNANSMDPKTSYQGWECGWSQKIVSLCVYFCQIWCCKSKAWVRGDTFVKSVTHLDTIFWASLAGGDGPSERNPIRTKAFFDLIKRKISFWWAFVLTGFSFWREFVLSGFRSHGLSFWWDFVLPGSNLAGCWKFNRQWKI